MRGIRHSILLSGRIGVCVIIRFNVRCDLHFHVMHEIFKRITRRVSARHCGCFWGTGLAYSSKLQHTATHCNTQGILEYYWGEHIHLGYYDQDDLNSVLKPWKSGKVAMSVCLSVCACACVLRDARRWRGWFLGW